MCLIWHWAVQCDFYIVEQQWGEQVFFLTGLPLHNVVESFSYREMWCTVHNQDIADITLKAFLLNWLTLFRTLSWRAPPNLQDGNVFLLERSDASPTLFLVVRLPCDFYFLQVDNMCSMISHHKLVCSQCLSCLQYLFPSRSARLTELLNIVWQIKLTLINASNYKYEISHFEVTFQWAWS